MTTHSFATIAVLPTTYQDVYNRMRGEASGLVPEPGEPIHLDGLAIIPEELKIKDIEPDALMKAEGLSVEQMLEAIETMTEDEAIAIITAFLETATLEMVASPDGWERDHALSIRAFTMAIASLNFVRELRSVKHGLRPSGVEPNESM